MSLKLALAALALGHAAAAPPPTSTSETVLVGHVHMAKTAGTSLNGLLASRYERVCGHKGYSYDSYGANLRMAAGRKINGRLTAFDSISKIQRGYHRERVPHRVMDEIGFEDCDFISEEQDWRFWRRFEDWPLPLELHVPCRDPLDHLMSQCNYRRRTFNCVDASRSPESLAREVRRCLTFLKRPTMKRFAWDLLGLKNTRVKCYNFSDQFSRYLAHMDKVLQKKRIPAKFIRWETNRPRNVSNECVWSADRGLKNDVVTYLRDHYDYYGFCDACLNQHANGPLLEPTMRGRQRAKNRTV